MRADPLSNVRHVPPLPIARDAEPAFAVYPGTALTVPIYRVVGSDPAMEGDFLSYAFMGNSYPSEHFFRASGVSCHLTTRDAARAQRRFRLGPFVAELDVRTDDKLMWAKTGGPGHVTVWAPPAVLLGYVTRIV